MQTTTAPAQTPDAEITGILADLAAVADRLVSTVQRQAGEQRVRLPVAGGILASTSRLTAAAVEVLSAVTHRGVIADEGLTIGSWLRSFAGCTIADERMLDNTANRLADMPTVRRWFADGTVSWSIVRGVVYAVRNLTKAQRRWVDDALADDADRVRRLGPDELVAAVERLADQARPDLHRDREQRAFEHEFFRLQLGFDGTSFGTFALNAEDTQTLINALRNVHPDTGTTNPTTGDDEHDTGTAEHAEHTADADESSDADKHTDGATAEDIDVDDNEEEGLGWRDEWRLRREATNVRALMALCKQRLGMTGGNAPAAGKPTMFILADLAALTGNGNGDGVGSATAQSPDDLPF